MAANTLSIASSAADGMLASQAAQRMPNLAGIKNAQQADKASRSFEAMFLSQMLGHMFEGIKTDGVFGGGSGEQMFRSMLLDEYGKMIANRGNGIGIADNMRRTLLRSQEVQ